MARKHESLWANHRSTWTAAVPHPRERESRIHVLWHSVRKFPSFQPYSSPGRSVCQVFHLSPSSFRGPSHSGSMNTISPSVYLTLWHGHPMERHHRVFSGWVKISRRVDSSQRRSRSPPPRCRWYLFYNRLFQGRLLEPYRSYPADEWIKLKERTQWLVEAILNNGRTIQQTKTVAQVDSLLMFILKSVLSRGKYY